MNAGSRPARGVISSEEPTCWTSGGLMPSLEEHRSRRLIALPWKAHPCPSGLTTSSLVGQLDSAAYEVSCRSGRPPSDCLPATSLLMRETAVGSKPEHERQFSGRPRHAGSCLGACRRAQTHRGNSWLRSAQRAVSTGDAPELDPGRFNSRRRVAPKQLNGTGNPALRLRNRSAFRMRSAAAARAARWSPGWRSGSRNCSRHRGSSDIGTGRNRGIP